MLQGKKTVHILGSLVWFCVQHVGGDDTMLGTGYPHHFHVVKPLTVFVLPLSSTAALGNTQILLVLVTFTKKEFSSLIKMMLQSELLREQVSFGY